MTAQPPLSNLQLELLKLVSRPVADEDLTAIKKLIANYFANKAAVIADEIWDEEGFSEETMQQWRESHLRTPYRPNISANRPIS
jgi:hypothetical protein